MKIKRENTAQLHLTDTVFFFGTYPLSNYLKKRGNLEAGCVSFLRQKAPDLVDTLD
jgi:hypothetical protein